MKYILYVIIAIFFAWVFFPSGKLMTYEYNGVTITRIDYDADIYFYYGKHNKNNLPSSYIKVHYSGFNSLVGAYLIFEKNKTVNLIGCYGLFESNEINSNSKLQLLDDGGNEYSFDYKKIKKNSNAIYLSHAYEFEKEVNLRNNSKVKAIYPY